jgi:hypothetical protein
VRYARRSAVVPSHGRPPGDPAAGYRTSCEHHERMLQRRDRVSPHGRRPDDHVDARDRLLGGVVGAVGVTARGECHSAFARAAQIYHAVGGANARAADGRDHVADRYRARGAVLHESQGARRHRRRHRTGPEDHRRHPGHEHECAADQADDADGGGYAQDGFAHDAPDGCRHATVLSRGVRPARSRPAVPRWRGAVPRVRRRRPT